MEAIDAAEEGGIEYLIVDSLSHAWSGEGGMLDMQGRAAQKSGNSYTAWREVTPEHNRLVAKILQCDMHVCLTLRSKTEYVLEEDSRGKKTPKKVGMAPVFRDGIEYEVTTFFEVDQQTHYATPSKDRTGAFDGKVFVLSPDTGKALHEWLVDGGNPADSANERPVMTAAVPPVTPVVQAEENPSSTEFVEFIGAVTSGLTKDQKKAVAAIIKKHNHGDVNYSQITDPSIQNAIMAEIRGAHFD
jgi:hypothetical protein